jgi:hypothetical protein
LDTNNVAQQPSSQAPGFATSIQALDQNGTSVPAARDDTSMDPVALLDGNDSGNTTFSLHHSHQHRHVSRNYRSCSLQTIKIHPSKIAPENSLQANAALETGFSENLSPFVNSECALDTTHSQNSPDQISTGFPCSKYRLDPQNRANKRLHSYMS